MSLNVPSRRLLKSAASPSSANALVPALQSLSITAAGPTTINTRSIHTTPSQQWSLFGWGKQKMEERKKVKEDLKQTELARTRKPTQEEIISRVRGRLEGDSIFADTTPSSEADGLAAEQDKYKDWATASAEKKLAAAQAKDQTATGISLKKDHLVRVVDPDPRSRVRWERKMVIRKLQRGTDPWSVEPKAERIARTERKLVYKTGYLPTSVKKLVHLSRQIRGKTVSEALVQMQFSKKKMAKEVKNELLRAEAQAIVTRGMGLGKAAAAAQKETGAEVQEPVKIQTKDGKHMEIRDPTRIYVAETFVNKGFIRGVEIDYRARGRVFKMNKPTTTMTVVLKEEKTRIREHQERVAKKLRQGPWVHLPNRPVTSQRQFYSW
ncbi:ribosomal protein L22/L17 [Neurospora tetraspora]|uniref:Ribosomal protein L22/L17 n=1 Tax=Neurospora tetraspora TaxID=94610 RepID=A0AAE0MTB9_9PEZI|nr:ribosomal protein L22/L17 [Neurospora tetraspora]